MLDYCKHTVDENASARKTTLSTHLENAKKEYADTPEAQELIKSAESMMDIQNYTVVEDIINRIQQKDFTNKTALDSKDSGNTKGYSRSYITAKPVMLPLSLALTDSVVAMATSIVISLQV